MDRNKLLAILLATTVVIVTSLGLRATDFLDPLPRFLGPALGIFVAVAVLGFVVHVRWHVPAISASRRRAVLAGQVRVDSAAGPKVSTGIAVDWGFSRVAATLAVFDDDTVIVYFYPRSAILGSSRLVRREDVVVAGNDLRVELRRLDVLFSSATQFALPRPGEITFYRMDARGSGAAGPMIVRELHGSTSSLATAERLARRLLTLVCGTLPTIAPSPVIALVTEDIG